MKERTGSNRWRRARLAIVIVLLVAGGLLVALLYSRPASDRADSAALSASAASREAVMTVTAAELVPAELTRTVTVNGSIHAWQEVIIAPEVGGYRVAEVYVDVGDKVTRGQELVELSTALLAAEVATKQATLKQHEAELINAEAELTRGQSLSAMNVLSEADLDRLRSAALVAQARLDSARADLETSRLRLQFTHVTAPDDGVITSRTVTVGQIAQAGTEMLRLLRNGRIEWRGEVPEVRLGDLRADQPVTVMTPNGVELAGTIRVVAPTITDVNRTGLVYVDLAPDDRIRPGMFARGEIEIGRGPGFTVPLQSVVSADGYSYVFVLRDDRTVERRRVETGAVRESGIEVVEGIHTGEMIVEKGAGFLKDGDLVNVAEMSGS
ncbi:MAG TPA: efflux RND transporter periplasmic adaptor subunit [Gammaproteobacteria bacterium]|nr:efflux RND transporter periplasmic adaptor subunit [Gammaproteobacteria bacterium]